MQINNRILRSSVSMLLIFALCFTGLFLYPFSSYAALQEVTVTKHRLDTGIFFIWCNSSGVWQGGHSPGSSYTYQASLPLGEGKKNMRIAPYTRSNFDFDDPNSIWYETAKADGKDTYEDNYYWKGAHVNNASIQYSGNTASFSVNVTLNANDGEPYDVVKTLKFQGKHEILDLMGGTSNKHLEDFMNRADFSGQVKGQLYFIPTVISWEETIVQEVPDVPDPEPGAPINLEADIGLPPTGMIGTPYDVIDETILPEGAEFASSTIERNDGSGWKSVPSWKGDKPGESISETADQEGSIQYRLTVNLKSGESDTDIKTIDIAGGTVVDAECHLELPAYTYESHPATAEDQSIYQVNGEGYSALRAYEEGKATNRFTILESGAGSIRKDKVTPIYATAVFPKKGTYNVQLKITPKNGGSLYDTKPIEVRKTPTVIAQLGGVQKQNRKQTLNIVVATNPDHALTTLYARLTNLKTGESVTLEHRFQAGENQLQNSNNIKTRAIEDTGSDEYFTRCTLPFLTKDGEVTEYHYKVYAKDSSGNWDSAEADFTVQPDLPPAAKIQAADTFLREKGTNTAVLEMEDASESDGDSLQRTWRIITDDDLDETFTERPQDITAMPGFADQSFGRLQRVSCEKTGVGKVKLLLAVRDVWTEETLPEYITEGDYLTDQTEKVVIVDNVAPVVTLEAIPARTASILLLAGNDQEYDRLFGQINAMQEVFLSKAVDAVIELRQLGKAGRDHDMLLTRLAQSGSGGIPWNGSRISEDQRRYTPRVSAVDEGSLYYVDFALEISKGTARPVPPYQLRAYDLEKKRPLWSYQLENGKSEEMPAICFDDQERYVYLAQKEKGATILLERSTGAYVTTLPIAAGKTNLYRNSNIYTLTGDGIYRVSCQTGQVVLLVPGSCPGAAGALIGSELHFFTVRSNTLMRGIFDPYTEQVRYEPLQRGYPTQGQQYTGVGIDAEGTILLDIDLYNSRGSDFGKRGWCAFGSENQLLALRPDLTSQRHTTRYDPVYDTYGVCRYVCSSLVYSSGKRKDIHVSCTRLSDGKELEMIYETIGEEPLTSETILYCGEDSDGMVIAVTGAWEYASAPMTRASCFDFASQTARALDTSDVEVLWPYYVNSARSSRYVAMQDGITLDAYQIKRTLDGLLNQELRAYRQKNRDLRAIGLLDATNVPGSKSTVIEEAAASGYSFYNLGGAGTYGEQLADQLSGMTIDPQKFLKGMAEEIVANKKTGAAAKLEVKAGGGNLKRQFRLHPAQTYYYEYEIKPEEGQAELPDLLYQSPVLQQKVDKSFLASESVSIAQSYIEDFDDNTLDPFFRLSSQELFQRDDYGKYGTKKAGIEQKERYFGAYVASGESFVKGAPIEAAIQFTVPKGERALLSFDYTMYPAGATREAELYIDGLEAYIPQAEGTYTSAETRAGAYTHPVVLSQGVHTISLRAGVYGSNTRSFSFLDNLRVDLLGEPAARQAGQPQKQKDGYTKVTGSFTTPGSVTKYQEIRGGKVISLEAPQLDVFGSAEQREITAPAGSKLLKCMVRVNLQAIHLSRNYVWIHYNGDLSTKNETTEFECRQGANNPLLYFYGNHIFTGNTKSGKNTKYTVSARKLDEENTLEVSRIFAYAVPGSYPVTDSYFESAGKLYDGVERYTGSSEIRFELPQGNYLLKNFRIYTLDAAGKKVYVDQTEFNAESDLKSWATSNLSARILSGEADKEQESLVYKKGELVQYGISYYDYENDPSKVGYWRYTHTPFNDGAHPEASVILDENGAIVSQRPDKILTAPIDRFYVDGKYTVEHWQYDDTSRKTKAGGNPLYDKSSNVESLTFYIEGGASAPWITSIATVPAAVQEGKPFQIRVGVDDAEKDVLHLTTEVYKEKKLIYTHQQPGITANASGIYPKVTTGTVMPKAQTGTYEVVCTVRDQTGAGLGSYLFYVISEGKITGLVNHTDQWDQNRKKYNLKRFKDEIQYVIPYKDYMKLKEPRKRGTNVFWSGEKFVLQAAVAGSPIKVTCKINGTDYMTAMKSTGKKNKDDELIYSGVLWDKSMINKWGRKTPKELDFTFTATYDGGTVKTDEASVIVDQREDYWQLHRLF